MTPLPAPRALVVINGDDVYEDLFSAGLKLAEILSAAGFAARTRAGREPVAYRRQVGRGRVCYLQLGHDMRAWDDPPVRDFVTRAAAWAHGEETR